MQSLQSSRASKGDGVKGGKWVETTLGILFVVDDDVQFADDWDHWKNAFCRLLEVSDEKAREFVEATVAAANRIHKKKFHLLSGEERLECLTDATTSVLYGGSRPALPALSPSLGLDCQGAPPNRVYATSIAGDKSRIVVGNVEHEYAWLADSATMKPITADSIVYDTAYYSSGGETGMHYGPKHYIAQTDWRIDKARRLTKLVLDNSGAEQKGWLKDPGQKNVIDIGSGLGYFRKGFDERGFKHFGIELSKDIIAKAKEQFDFDTWNTPLLKLHEASSGTKFHIITLWDVLEHVEDPLVAVQYLKEHLTNDGVLVIRTPNVTAMEVDILGDFYYSFKFDHMKYMSADSLKWIMAQAGLKPLYVESASHIFKGFLSADYLYKAGLEMKGADLIGIYGAG